MKSTEQKIKSVIEKSRSKKIFFTEDFRGLGSAQAVKTALHRLGRKGIIRRLGRGIYGKPYESELVGEVLPAVEEVAIAIAKRDKARIMPTGSYAMHALGLSDQVPMKIVYLTDGSPRMILIRGRSIKFKKTSPKNLALKGKISRLVVQAMKDIGKGKMYDNEEKRILSLLKKEDRKILKHDIALAPQWIGEFMAKAL